MVKASALIFGLGILAFATISYSEVFDVKGYVYCDPCRLGFKNSLGYGLQGAKVELTCTNIENGSVTFTKQATTEADGAYTISVEGDHQDELCEVQTVSSGSETCTVPIKATARIVCTENSGMHTDSRLANALGFMNANPIQGCKKVIEELELDDIETTGSDLSSDEVATLQ